MYTIFQPQNKKANLFPSKIQEIFRFKEKNPFLQNNVSANKPNGINGTAYIQAYRHRHTIYLNIYPNRQTKTSNGNNNSPAAAATATATAAAAAQYQHQHHQHQNQQEEEHFYSKVIERMMIKSKNCKRRRRSISIGALCVRKTFICVRRFFPGNYLLKEKPHF